MLQNTFLAIHKLKKFNNSTVKYTNGNATMYCITLINTQLQAHACAFVFFLLEQRQIAEVEVKKSTLQGVLEKHH